MNIAGGNSQILYVEDEEASARMVKDVLEHAGYACHIAPDAMAGFRIALQKHIDLLLLDLALPGIDGVEFLSVLRALEVPVPVIVVSAQGTERLVAGVASLGVEKFLAKPVSPRQLLVEVKAAMPRRPRTYRLLGMARDGAAGTARRTTNRNGRDRKTSENEADLFKARSEVDSLAARVSTLERDLEFARMSADQAKESLVGSARALLGILENREAFSGSHGARVADYALRIADRMALPEASIHALEVAALLHDIGKVGLPVEVLTTAPEHLVGEARAAYMLHPDAGHAIIQHMTGGGGVAEIVRAHHERYDGAGFPDGLKGSSIPVEARIIAVADNIDRLVQGADSESIDFTGIRRAFAALRERALDPIMTDHALEIVDELERFLLGHSAQLVDVLDVEIGAVLAQDVISPDGFLYLHRGTVVTRQYRDRLFGLAAGPRGQNAVLVYAPTEEAEDG